MYYVPSKVPSLSSCNLTTNPGALEINIFIITPYSTSDETELKEGEYLAQGHAAKYRSGGI